MTHLGELATVAVYENDRFIREVRYQHQRSDTVSYRLRIWALNRPDLEGILGADQQEVSVEPRRARSPELCIDFVNTFIKVSLCGEKLDSYAELLQWAEERDLVTRETVELLQLIASLRASEAEKGDDPGSAVSGGDPQRSPS